MSDKIILKQGPNFWEVILVSEEEKTFKPIGKISKDSSDTAYWFYSLEGYQVEFNLIDNNLEKNL